MANDRIRAEYPPHFKTPPFNHLVDDIERLWSFYLMQVEHVHACQTPPPPDEQSHPSFLLDLVTSEFGHCILLRFLVQVSFPQSYRQVTVLIAYRISHLICVHRQHKSFLLPRSLGFRYRGFPARSMSSLTHHRTSNMLPLECMLWPAFRDFIQRF